MRYGAFLIVVSLVVSISACAPAYEFRNDDRPTYTQTVTPGEAQALSASGATVFDVRLLEDFEANPVLIPTAAYRNPELISEWASEIDPGDGPVVVYCVAGKWVSQKAATYLSEQGVEVYSIEGGINAWSAEGRETTGSANP